MHIDVHRDLNISTMNVFLTFLFIWTDVLMFIAAVSQFIQCLYLRLYTESPCAGVTLRGIKWVLTSE